MNWSVCLLVKKKFPYYLFVSIFLWVSCEKPKEIGINIQPQGRANVTFTDTFSLKISTVTFDSVNTAFATTLLAGHYQDPELGKLTARSYLQLRFAGNNLAPQGVVEYDSLVLILPTPVGPVSSYGNLDKEQTINVHRLTQSLDTIIYYQFNAINYDNTKRLGRAKAKARDILTRQVLRIKLDDDFGREIASLANNQVSRDAFLAAFKGLALVEDADNEAIMGFTDRSIMRFYYRITGDATPQTIDFAPTLRFNQLIPDRSNTILAGRNKNYEAIPSTQTNHKVYNQPETGLVSKIEFPTFYDLKKLGNTVGINKAELVIRAAPNTTANLPPPSIAQLYETNITNRFIFVTNPSTRRLVPKVIPSEASADNIQAFTPIPASAGFSNARQEYRIDITTYLQLLLKQGNKGRDILVFSVQNYQPNRLIINANPNHNNRTKLEVTYSVFGIK